MAMAENGQTIYASQCCIAQAVPDDKSAWKLKHRAKGSTGCSASATIRNCAWMLKQWKHVVPGYSAYARMAACDSRMLKQRMRG